MASVQEQLKALLEMAGAPKAAASQMPMANNAMFNQAAVSASNPPEQPQILPLIEDPVESPPPPQAASSLAMGGSRSPASHGGGGMSSTKELQDLLRKQIGQSEEAQKKNIDLNKMMLAGQLGKKQLVDLSGGYATARMLGAKDAGEGYKAPEDVSKGDHEALNSLSKAQQALTDDQISQLRAELSNRLAQQALGSQRNQIMQDRMDRNEHMKIIGDVKKDPIIKDYAGKMNAIDRANILLDKAKNVTTASLEEYQQGLRSALTNIKGSGGVSERAETYIKTLDMQLAKIKQAMGDLDSIPKNHPLIQHLRDLGDHAQDIISKQLDNRMGAVAGGRKSLYGRRPDLMGDLDELKTLMRDSAAAEKDFGDASAANPHKTGSMGSDTAVAKPAMSEDEFIKKFLEAKRAQNGK